MGPAGGAKGSGLLDEGGGWSYQTIADASDNDGDMLKVLDVPARDVGIIGIFSDWPATVTFYANCMGLKWLPSSARAGGCPRIPACTLFAPAVSDSPGILGVSGSFGGSISAFSPWLGGAEVGPCRTDRSLRHKNRTGVTSTGVIGDGVLLRASISYPASDFHIWRRRQRWFEAPS
jgi:hypothetical protein